MTTDEVERSENNSNDDCPECPLCMETLDLDDINFYPCTCGYQVCKFCWHRMKTDENGLCPACRQKYPDDPVEFRPIATEAMQRFKSKKQQQRVGQKRRDGKDKSGDRIIDSRKHLATIRVVQKNLVFVIGLPPKLTDPEALKRPEYFGKFGKILKVMVNVLNANGTPASSASAYITYVRADDALRAIKALNNLHLEGRVLKASLGTTKYCVNFLKNTPCAKPECMYLHDLGDGAASFTKEDMQQGKHQEYEKQLLDSLSSSTAPVNGQAAAAPVTEPVAPSLNKAGSCEDVVVAVERQRRGSAMPVPLQQRDSSPSSSSSSLSSSTGSLKSTSESQSHSERNSPSVAFDLFVDTFEEFGFDPWNESSKGLADLMEMESRSRATSTSASANPFGAGHPFGMVYQQQSMGYMPGYGHNHMDAAFGMGAYAENQQQVYMQQQQQYRQRMMLLNQGGPDSAPFAGPMQQQPGDMGYGYPKWQGLGAAPNGMMPGYRGGQRPMGYAPDMAGNQNQQPAPATYSRSPAAPSYRLTVQ